MTAVLLALSLHLVAPVEAATDRWTGEELKWELEYAGVTAGEAWARAEDAGDGLVRWVCGARNAPWLDRIYTVDDQLQSIARVGGGSVYYETRYREGGFTLDEQMYLDRDPFQVFRKQLKKGDWREWWSEEPAATDVDDPVSGLVRVRELQGDGPWSFPVFSGRKTWPVEVELVGREVVDTPLLGEVSVRVLSLNTQHEGDLNQKGRWLVRLTDDARRIPVSTRIETSLGAVKGTLTDWRRPGPET